ncbi:helix-turn-helix domain-containing protein [Methyloprofundus sp.]|uniref:AraC family transcriptional regulator n=1 Tax=Methyloprofundus sp. TaxID=2020875 RepID=UPI003D0A8126
METIALHKTTIIRPFTDYLNQVVAPVERILRLVKLPALALDDPDYYISSLAFWAFVEKMATIEGIPDLGFLVGKHFGANSLDPNYRKVLANTPSLYHALIKTCLAVNTGTSRSHMLVYSVRPGSTQFCHRTSYGVKHSNQQRMEWFALAAMIAIVQEFTGPLWRPKEIGLMSSHAPSNLIREYLPNGLFRSNQIYGHINIETPLLSLPPLTKNNKRFVEPDPTLKLSTLGVPAVDFIGSLKQALQAHLIEGTPKIELAAEMTGTSVRTLQRELAKTKLSYIKLLAQARFDTASRLLQDNNLRVDEIAFRLGYQDASHFARAFRRSSGMSPTEYRKASN